MSTVPIIFLIFCLSFILYVFIKARLKSKSASTNTPVQPPPYSTIDSLYPNGLNEGDYVKGINPEIYILKHGLKFFVYSYIVPDEVEVKVLEEAVLNSIPNGTNF